MKKITFLNTALKLKRMSMVTTTLVVCVMANTSISAEPATNKVRFFINLSNLCEQTFEGKTVFPEKPEAPFDQELIMRVASCSANEIRIPFQVGEDTSRTWIISRTQKGLLFKHDHRHKDGTPHELTMYGGYADNSGTELVQSFPADEETKVLVPAGTTNVWQLALDFDKNTFTYYLTRHGKPRYRAIFDLSKPMADKTSKASADYYKSDQ